ENWADEGPGFKAIDVPGLGKVGFGICMDINPYKFTAPFDAYEFTNFHLQQKTDIILCSMAWLDSETSAVDYWLQRLFPLINDAEYRGFRPDARNPETAIKRNVLFVVCNRTGTEEGVTFCGSSIIVSISSRGEIHMLGSLGIHQEDVIVVDVPSL
ncbi:2841_t:CDS:2, partial [Acaulospora morrowiae]